MATFTVSADTNWHSLTGRAGSDAYAITNATLTIDGDVRYGPNTTATTGPFGNITLNGVKGGLLIDGSNVWLIPYTGGTGNVPAADTVITQGAVTAKLLGVWSAINVPPTAAGAAMPASGFIKVRQRAGGSYASGALSGIGATSSGANVAGWIEIVGVDTLTLANSALSATMTAEYRGAWFELGVTSGVRNQVLQGPASLTETRYPGVFIETSAGSNDFRFWPSAGGVLNIAQDERGKHVWCDAQGGVRIGHNGTADAGLLPAAGLRVVIGNVFLLNTNATVGLGANVTPASANTRYTYANSLLKTILSKVMCGWRSNGNYAAEAYDTCFQDEWALACSKPFVYRRVGVGPTGVRANVTQIALVSVNLDTDAICEDYNFACIALASTAARAFNFLNSYGGTYRRGRVTILTRTFAAAAVAASSAYETVFDDLELVGGGHSAFERSYTTNLKFADRVFGTQDGTIPQTAIAMSPNSTIDGITWLTSVANTCHPVVRFIGTADGCTVRNVGSLASPVPMGTTNPCQAGINPIGGTAGVSSDIRRIYTTAVNNGAAALVPITFGKDSRIYDVSMAATATPGPNTNAVVSGWQTNGLQNPPTTANFGAHFVDGFYSDTQGFIDFWPTEPVAVGESPTQLTFSGAKFSGTSWVNLPTPGDWIDWVTGWVYGHTGFQSVTQFLKANSAIASTVVSTFCTMQYDLDKGSGFSGTLTALTGANLAAETGIDPAVGFRMRVRITSTTTNTNVFYAQRIFTTTTATERYRLHNLSDQIVIVNGLAAGSRVKVSRVDTGAILFAGLESGGVVRATLGYVGQVRIEARKASSAPYYQPWVSLADLAMKSTTTITAVQLRDDQ